MFVLLYQKALFQQSNAAEQTVAECRYVKHEGIALGSQKALLKKKHCDFFILKLLTLSFELALWKEAGLKGKNNGEHGFHQRVQLSSFPMHYTLHVVKSVLAPTPPLTPELFKPGFWGAWALRPLGFGDQERARFGRSFFRTGGTHRCATWVQVWILPTAEALNQWEISCGEQAASGWCGALPGWLLPQTSHLHQGICHPPITLPPLTLAQYICSYVYNTPFLLISNSIFSFCVGKADEELWVSVTSALLTCAWQGKFLFTSTRKSQRFVFSLVWVSSQKLVFLVHDGSLQVKGIDQLDLQPRICPGHVCLCCGPEQKDHHNYCHPRRFSRTPS